jgi:hypothetical protein
LNLHAEITVQTEEPHLAEVIEIDGFQVQSVNPSDSAFFGGPTTAEERLVEVMLLDQRAQ